MFLRDVVRILCIFSFLSFIDTLFLYIRSCDHFYTYIVLILFICGCLDDFCLKCFRNTGCQSLLAINSLLTSFSRVCVRIDFIVFNK